MQQLPSFGVRDGYTNDALGKGHLNKAMPPIVGKKWVSRWNRPAVLLYQGGGGSQRAEG